MTTQRAPTRPRWQVRKDVIGYHAARGFREYLVGVMPDNTLFCYAAQCIRVADCEHRDAVEQFRAQERAA